jgi:hypothetical protein
MELIMFLLTVSMFLFCGMFIWGENTEVVSKPLRRVFVVFLVVLGVQAAYSVSKLLWQ